MNRFAIRDKAVDFVIYAILIIIGVATIYPFLNVLAISLNDSTDSVRGGIYFLPRVFTLESYQEILGYQDIIHGFGVSVARTVLGTVFGILCTAMLAYVLSRKDFFARKFFTVLLIITMYVSGGMIPDFMLIRKLHLVNNFFVYILPGLISVWNVIVLRSFIDTLPASLQESAKLDGANDLVIFTKIIFPLCTPVIATLCLFIAVGHWNSWFDNFLYTSSKRSLTTLQFELQRILRDAMTTSSLDAYRTGQGTVSRVSPESIRMAMTIITTVPILCVYPFLQKYFVKGLVIGAIKE